jgi:large subunit ribosomal protein L30
MAKIKIVQKRSKIGCNKRQRRTLQALGLGRISKSVEVEGTPQILGMVNKLNHIVKIEK